MAIRETKYRANEGAVITQSKVLYKNADESVNYPANSWFVSPLRPSITIILIQVLMKIYIE